MAQRSKHLIAIVVLAVVFLIAVILDWQLTSGHRSLAELFQAAALGPQRVMQVFYAVLLLSFTWAVAKFGFKPPPPEAKRRNIGLLCLMGAALGLAVSAIFAQPAIAADAHWTGTYWMHLLGGAAATVFIPVAMFAFAWRFHTVDKDDSLTTWTLVAAITTLGIAVAVIVFPPHALAGPTPLMAFVARRAHFLVLFAWCLAVFLHALGDTPETQPVKRESTGGEAVSLTIDALREALSGGSKKGGFDWETFAAKIEVLTLPLVLIGGVIALLEYSDGHKRDIREVSKSAYEKADSNWTEFLKLCADHPETSCYDGAPDTGSDDPHQGPVLSMVIDTFETAFRNYNDAEYANDATENYCDEWPTWMLAMRRYARRPSFQRVWTQVGGEYGQKFQLCMEATIKEQTGLAWNEQASLSAPPPKDCRMDVCEAVYRPRGSAQ